MSDWTHDFRLHQLSRGPQTITLVPDADQRAAIAKALDLESLSAFTAKLVASAWMDGVALQGQLTATLEQICGVTLDSFEQVIEADIDLRVVPATSPHAPSPDGGEIERDADSPDAPDVMTGDSLDLAAYAVEHLALALDPFPRKPGATFTYEAGPDTTSAFAGLKSLIEPKA